MKLNPLAFNAMNIIIFFKQKAFADFIRRKQTATSNGYAMSSVKDSRKETIKLVGHKVDMQSLT